MADDDALDRELAALRRRAYGRGADIHDDPGALARLIALEELMHAREPDLAEATPEPARPELVAAPRAPEDDAPQPAVDSSAPPAPSRRRLSAPAIALAAIVAVAAIIGGSIVVGGLQTGSDASGPRAEPTASPTVPVISRRVAAFTTADDTRLLVRIPLDGSFGPYVDLPSVDPPSFPTDSPLEWAEPIGRYYGTHVWIARTESGRACLLVDLGARTRSSCVDEPLFGASALLVTVPFFELKRDERPDAMGRGESLGFWWRPEGRVDVMVGPTADMR